MSKTANQFGIQKISTNTHLYTSDEPITDFPGRQFEIVGGKEEIKKAKQANVITRNYPLTPEQILKKYGLKEGGDTYVIGFRDVQEKPWLVLCKRI